MRTTLGSAFLSAIGPLLLVSGGTVTVSLDPVNVSPVDLARPGPENLKAGFVFSGVILP